MNILDYITITVFVVGMVLAGVSFSSTGKSMKGFFAGGGNVPWWIAGLSLFMGFFSAGTFVVWGSIAYSQGFVAIVIQLTMAAAGFLVGAAIAPRWNRTGCLTAAEYITRRYGARTQKMYTYLFLFISIFTTGSFLYPIAKIVEVSTGIPLSACILLLGGFSILYVAIGGLRAVVVTDVLQFLILLAAVVIIIPLSMNKIGGIGELFARAPEGFFRPVGGEYTWTFIIAFMLYNTFFLGGNWAYVQRYTSVGTPRDARKVGIMFGVLYTVSPILWMLPPMIYRIFSPSLVGLQNEDAYLLMCKEAMPVGMMGLMIGGMIFATASALNATLNVSAGVFTNDIFKRLRPATSQKTLMRIARWSTVGFGLLAISIALLIPKMGGVVNVVISIAALTGVPLYLPLIWSLFSKNLTGRVIMGITLVGLGVNALLKFVMPWLSGLSLDKAREMAVGVSVPVILLIGYEIYHRLSGSEKSVPMITRRADEDTDNEQVDNSHSLRIIGLGAMIAGGFVSVLSFFAGKEILVPLVVGLILTTFGVVVFIKAKKN